MKKNFKLLLEDIVKDWKLKNKETISQIPSKDYDLYFKTLLINYPRDSTWIYNLSSDKFSSIITSAPVETFNTGDTKYTELKTINLLDPTVDDENWEQDSEEQKTLFLNLVVDCSKCTASQDLIEVSDKFNNMAKLIIKGYRREFKSRYGDEFDHNLFDVILKESDENNKIKIVVSFINISDSSILLNKLFQNDSTEKGMIDDKDIYCNYYNSERMLNLYRQCETCQWPYVKSDEELQLTSKDVCKYTTPDKQLTGYMCNVSALSIAALYKRYKEGLFAGNIRYFIKRGKGSQKVNEGLEKSIKDKEKRAIFYFKNNGITFITPDVKINDKTIKMNMFSIVNGGQTTYKLGTIDFDSDFTVPCKILKINIDVSDKLKKNNEELYKKNLNLWLKYAGEISEALNSQKPVSEKDLITNKSSVRRLKHYYNNDGNNYVILLTKAGEESYQPSDLKNKLIKLETYLNLVYCFYLQMPGFAKNKKSQMYKETNVNRVLGNEEDSDCKKFFSPKQLAEINAAKKILDKSITKIDSESKKNPDLYTTDDDKLVIKLLKNSKNIVLSMFGLMRMSLFHNDMFEYYDDKDYFKDHFTRKSNRYVDLRIPLFQEEAFSSPKLWKDCVWELGKNILLPAYKQYYDYQIAHYKANDVRTMTIDDTHYFNFVVGQIKTMYSRNPKNFKAFFIDLMNFDLGI